MRRKDNPGDDGRKPKGTKRGLRNYFPRQFAIYDACNQRSENANGRGFSNGCIAPKYRSKNNEDDKNGQKD